MNREDVVIGGIYAIYEDGYGFVPMRIISFNDATGLFRCYRADLADDRIATVEPENVRQLWGDQLAYYRRTVTYGPVEATTQYAAVDTGDFLIWPERDEFFDVNEIEPGLAYYQRTVTYGPWERQVRDA